MATLPKVLISRADYQIGGGVALRLRTQDRGRTFLLEQQICEKSVARSASGIPGRKHRCGSVLSLLLILVVFTISTFVGEWLEGTRKLIPVLETVHKLMFAGEPNEITGRPGGFFSNRLVITDQSFVDVDKLDRIDVSYSFRGRDLRQAVLN